MVRYILSFVFVACVLILTVPAFGAEQAEPDPEERKPYYCPLPLTEEQMQTVMWYVARQYNRDRPTKDDVFLLGKAMAAVVCYIAPDPFDVFRFNPEKPVRRRAVARSP